MAVAGTAHGQAERRWLYAGFALALVLFAVGAWGVHRQNVANEVANAQVEGTLRILRQALQLDAELLLMENEHRAFLVTGDDRFLVDRDAHHAVAGTLLASLRERAGDDPAQRERLDLAGTLLAQRFERMRGTVEIARTEGHEAARTRFRGDGSGSLDPLREQLSAVRNAESAELATRAQAAGVGAERLRWAIFAMPATGRPSSTDSVSPRASTSSGSWNSCGVSRPTTSSGRQPRRSLALRLNSWIVPDGSTAMIM